MDALALFTLIATSTTASLPVQIELLHSFNHVDYEWSSFPITKQEAINNGIYNPTKVTVTGVKQWKDTLYVTSPRWLAGVPTSLNTVTMDDALKNMSVLKPFPNYELQVIGNVSCLQYVQSMEIDRRGWMWIIDVGRVNLFEPNAKEYTGAPKLWIWDIDANKLIHSYTFPNDIASHSTSFLNDIFVDDVLNVAYISETSGNGAILVYDYGKDTSRRWDGHPSLSYEDPLPSFVVEGYDINQLGPLPVDGKSCNSYLIRISLLLLLLLLLLLSYLLTRFF